jgi:hypothetical protein
MSSHRAPADGVVTILGAEAMHSRKAIYSNMPESDYGIDTARQPPPVRYVPRRNREKTHQTEIGSNSNDNLTPTS